MLNDERTTAKFQGKSVSVVPAWEHGATCGSCTHLTSICITVTDEAPQTLTGHSATVFWYLWSQEMARAEARTSLTDMQRQLR